MILNRWKRREIRNKRSVLIKNTIIDTKQFIKSMPTLEYYRLSDNVLMDNQAITKFKLFQSYFKKIDKDSLYFRHLPH